MFTKGFIATICLCSAVAAKAVPATPAEIGHLDDRQIIGGLECVVAGIVVLLQDLLLNPAATPFCQRYGPASSCEFIHALFLCPLDILHGVSVRNCT